MPSSSNKISPFAVVADDDHGLAALASLAGLPGMSPARLWSLLALDSPAAVWQRVVAGDVPGTGRERDPSPSWPGAAVSVDLGATLDRHRGAGIEIVPYAASLYPSVLLDDPDPPAVLFMQGPRLLDDRTRVGIVGTRQCTGYGREVAQHLGRELARRGIDVASGLASGIDAAAHAGANSVAPERLVAVVAGGVDVIYPSSNRGLYLDVAGHGVLLSEWPAGSRPHRWRFPARNRLVAGLCAAIVVVESAAKGGSMYTVDEALRRNREVFAVPGDIRSPVSFGTNKLIAEGAHSLHDIDALLDTLAPQDSASVAPAAFESWLLDLIGWTPMALDDVVRHSGYSPLDVTLEVERLVSAGVVRRNGAMIERGSP